MNNIKKGCRWKSDDTEVDFFFVEGVTFYIINFIIMGQF